MIIKIKKGQLKNGASTFGEWFKDFDIFPVMEVCSNWEDVLENIKVSKLKRRAQLEGILRGDEYPSATPLREEDCDA